ncbi:unnamed protein product [Acanthoscelides obtectus]|uniref:Cytochrome b n=1 Tax=Acanthoscelides obtectus TaxID=200917 RepID=A0A9P0M626_ACAOB|nr:unnamed protein product [Acanthoscelides obtectus]CAK1627592.1 Cytochrome b [Acanthoscelides obtectus]
MYFLQDKYLFEELQCYRNNNYNLFLVFLTLNTPYVLGDPDNLISANPLLTPVHIQTEWYFLFAYKIVRSITNKVEGVIALVISIIAILYIIPFINKKILKNPIILSTNSYSDQYLLLLFY